jgi:hypothetical protein
VKRIPLTRGLFAIVDDEDFDALVQFKWCVAGSGYAATARNRKITYMHRVLLDAPNGVEVDHINGDRLDNRRINLRLCTKSQNNQARRTQPGASGFIGVSWYAPRHTWCARVYANGRKVYCRYFTTPEAAARARDAAAREHHGDFARLNFPSAA